MNALIAGVTLVNPPNAGILAYHTVGVEISGNTLQSAYSGVWIEGHVGIQAYGCASLRITGNNIQGTFTQAISGGGDSDYLFDDYAGTASDVNTRDVLISGNKINNYLDHGVYFFNLCIRTTVSSNSIISLTPTSSEAIKLTGSVVVTGNNTVSLDGGFAGRSLYDSVISANKFKTMGLSTTKGVVTIEGYESFSQDVTNVIISNNQINSGGAGMARGVFVYGQRRISTGVQNLLKLVTISSNQISGSITYAGIQLYQEKHSTPASSLYGEDVTVDGNTIVLKATGGIYGVLLSGEAEQASFDRAVITGNSITNCTGYGIRVGMKNGLVSDNIVKPFGSSGKTSEAIDTDTPSGNNYFGRVVMPLGISGGVYALASSTSSLLPLDVDYNGALSGNTTLSARYPFSKLVYNPTAARAITLVSAADYVFPVNYTVTVSNISSTYALTFQLVSGGATSTIGANSSATFLCTGSNTFVKLN